MTNKLGAWEQMNLQWAKNFTGDVHIVYFEDLVQNVDSTLRGILQFLHFPINEVIIIIHSKYSRSKFNTLTNDFFILFDSIYLPAL